MKHLKDRKVFEDKTQTEKATELIPDLKDICLELEDEGFDISFASHESSGNPYTATYVYHVCIQKNGTYRYNEQVKEVCERIKDYLGDNYKEIYVRPTIGDEYYRGSKIPEIFVGRAVFVIKIYFTV